MSPIPTSWEAEAGRLHVEDQSGNLLVRSLSQKFLKKNKKGCGCSSVECLPSVCKVLALLQFPSTAKEKQKQGSSPFISPSTTGYEFLEVGKSVSLLPLFVLGLFQYWGLNPGPVHCIPGPFHFIFFDTVSHLVAKLPKPSLNLIPPASGAIGL